MGKWGKFVRPVTVWALEEGARGGIEDGRYVGNFLLFTVAFTVRPSYFKIYFWISQTSLCLCVHAHFPRPDLYCQLRSRYKMRSERIHHPHSQASQGQHALSCFSVLEKIRTDKGEDKRNFIVLLYIACRAFSCSPSPFSCLNFHA